MSLELPTPQPRPRIKTTHEFRVYVCIFRRKQRTTLRRLRASKSYACVNCLKQKGLTADVLRAIYRRVTFGVSELRG